jgi:dipeptidyl aminopeptidase/acylaminoacyl peptidase
MTPEDVYELTGVGEVRVDPTGRTAAYTVSWIDPEDHEYRSAIWLAQVDGSEPPRQFTSGEGRDGSLAWSPDGTRLAFAGKRGDDETLQLHVLPVAGGEPVRLTKLKEDVGEPAWSPDGSQLAFVARARSADYDEEDQHKRRPRRITRLHYKHDNVGWTVDRPQQVFLVAADGSGEPRQLTREDAGASSPAWSPDGSRIAVVSAVGDEWDIESINDLLVVDAAGGEAEVVTHRDGTCEAPAWSPDGTRLAYRFAPDLHDFPRHTQLAVLDLASRERRILTESLDRNCGPYPAIAGTIWDGGRIVFGVEDAGDTHVYAVAADGSSAPEALVAGRVSVASFDLAGGTLVHATTRGMEMRQLYNGEQRLTDVGRAFVDGRELVQPEHFTAISADGTELDAWLVRPAGFVPDKRYPTLLSIHGGPFSQYPSSFFDEFQVFAGAGYAVLYANPRGSSGYSEEWGRAICGPIAGGPGWGTVDYEDVMGVVDTALDRYDCLDPERLGVIGGSYGGFMTSWIVSHTNRFKAACSERAVNHLLSAFGSSDLFWLFSRHFGGTPYDDMQAWLDRSPAAHATAIETPLLILHSEDDLRCNVEQAEHLFVALRLQRKPVELVRFPAEGHELSRSGSPVHRVARFEVILEWFDRHLK